MNAFSPGYKGHCPYSIYIPVHLPHHSSPPLLSWNLAAKAPPDTPPPASHFPENTYFSNIWDMGSHDQPVPEDSGGLFPVPSAPSIPEAFIN